MRKIIHVDMDAYFAAIEQRDAPELRGKPVVVGGQPNSRGVVCTASYEARKFGVRSAMPCSQAYHLCPQAIFVPPRFDVYKHVSRQIMDIFREFSDLVEPLSLDEAYIDVTENKLNYPYATQVAKEIKRRIRETTALTASAGVAPNKFLAKVASDMRKPDGLTVITPERVSVVLQTLAIRAVPGVGPVTEKRMHEHGILTTGDLLNHPQEDLVSWFGKSGRWFYNVARGIDEREVENSHERKSVGAEETFAVDLQEFSDWERELRIIIQEVTRRLRKQRLFCRSVTVKATFADFQKATRSATLNSSIDEVDAIEEAAFSLLRSLADVGKPVRLLGVSLSKLSQVATVETEELVSGVEQLSFAFP